MSEDYYKILSVEPTASKKEIQEAADRLISVWDKKRGLSFNKRSEMLSQIRKAHAVLIDPLQRYEYDIEHGFKRNFSGQALTKKRECIPLKFSESIEALDTVKIPGQLDYEKLEKSIAAMETLMQVKGKPDIKLDYGSESTINYAKDQLPFSNKMEAIESIRKSESVESSQFPSNDKKAFDTSSDTDINLKQHDLSLFTDRIKLQKYKGTDIRNNVEAEKNTSNNKPVCEKNSKEIIDIMKERKCQVVPSQEVTKLIRSEEELMNENSQTDFTVDSKSVYEKQQMLVPKEIQTFSKGREFLENESEIKHVDSVQLARKYLLERKRDPGTSSALENEKFEQQKSKTSVRLSDGIFIIPADSEDAINTIYKSRPFNKKSSNLKQDFTIDGKKDTEILPSENESLEKDDKIEHVDSYEIIQNHFSMRKTKPNLRSAFDNENSSKLKSSLSRRSEIGKSTSEKRNRSITLSDEVTIIPRMEVKSDECMPRVSLESKSPHAYLGSDFETDETGTSYLLPEEIDEIIKHSLLTDKIRSSRRTTEPDIGSIIGDKFSGRRLSLSYDDEGGDEEGETSVSDDAPEIPSEEEISSGSSGRTLTESAFYSNLNRLLTSEEERDSKDSPNTADAADSEEIEYLTKDYKQSLTVNSNNNPNDKEGTKISPDSSKDSRRNSSAANSKNNLNDKENSEMSQNPSKDFRRNSPPVNPKNKKSSKMLTNLSEHSRHNSPATNSKNNPKHKENSKIPPNLSEEESDKRATHQNQITSDENPTVSPDLDKKKVGEKIMMKDKRDSLKMSSNKENSSRSDQSVSAITRIAGTDIKTVYTFGSDSDSIEVFVNRELKVKIIKGEKQHVYSNEMKHDDLPAVGNICASTVIAANSCVITTEVTRRGRKESISVYKNDTLLCRTGSSVLEE